MNEGSFGFLLQEKDRLQDHLMQTTFKLGAGQSLEAWKVDYELATSLADQVNIPTVRVTLKDAVGGEGGVPLVLSEEKFRLLYHELKKARSLMDEM